MQPFEIIWNKITQLQGESFSTIRNIDFTYQIQDNRFIRNGINWNITKKDFQFVYDNFKQYNGPGSIPPAINGRSYVWAILNDTRITGSEV